MIKEFKGEYNWLSNFSPCRVKFEGETYKSVEHAYMAAKSKDTKWRKFCKITDNAGKVKVESRKIILREDWEDVKISIMRDLLTQKFSNPVYKTKLLQTKDEEIQEGNYWGDKFWGVCLKTNSGQNVLGKLIMEIRQNLQGE